MAAPTDGSVRAFLKRGVFVSSVVLVSPLLLLHRLAASVLDPEASMQGFSQFLSLVPGPLGDFVRKGFYAYALRGGSSECTISFGTLFSTTECAVGRHVYIGAYCVISDCTIGDDTLLGSQVHVISGKHAHGFEDPDAPMRLQKTSRQTIHIGANTWIGNGAIVMADVGAGCVVGAGSVVTKPVADNSIVAGNPARVIRSRVPLDTAADASPPLATTKAGR